MPNETAYLAFAGLAGLGLGIFYFGLLWVTLEQLPRVTQPAVLLGGSFVLRSVVVIASLYLLTQGRLSFVAAAMLGFILARLVLTRHWKPRGRSGAGTPRI